MPVLAVAACAVFVRPAWGAKSDAPNPTVVPLLVDVPKGMSAPAGWPVTTGVPFSDGQLTEAQLGTLRVETDAGQPVPAQFEVRGRYLRSRAVKWLGVSFQLVPDDKGYRLVSDGAGPGHASPVRVEKASDGFVVSTGLIRVEIPGVGPVLSKLWMGKELVLEQGPQDGNWLITLDGQRHSEKAEKAVLERQGPLHSTIRVDGRYVDETGQPSCKWTARLHFFAGRPEIGITHTFFWIGRQDTFGIRDLAISFGLKQPAVEATADASDDTRGEAVTRPLGKGEALSLFQESYWHHGQGNSHFGIFHGLAGREQQIAKGERAGSWLGVRVKSGTVTLGLKDLWQQFPNELEARSDRVTAYLWRTRGKAPPLDLSFSGLENLLGPVLNETYRSQMKHEYAQIGSDPESLDPTGVAKTHDLLLAFHPTTSVAPAAATGEIFDDPPLVLPDPLWTYHSGVVGPLWPKDPQRFPEWEKRIEQTWRDVFEVIDDWGDYGFIHYGDGPHYTYRFNQEGRPVADVMRYTGIDAWVQHVAWLAYLRSGEGRHFRYAHAHTRFLGAHPFINDTLPKYDKLKAGAKPNPFIDPEGWQKFLQQQEAEFKKKIVKPTQ